MREVIIPCSIVPDGAIVTKRTGSKRYRLIRRVRLFGPGRGTDHETICPENGNVFLTPADDHTQVGDFNELDGDTEVRWKIDDNTLRSLLTNYAQLKRYLDEE